MKLLLAEDERRMADALAELLRLEKYEVDQVFDGSAALMAIKSSAYDVIVLDIMMPEMSGLEVVRSVRLAGIQTPILLLTAKDSLKDKVSGLDSGADDYLTKPFESEELFSRLRALCRRGSGIRNGIYSYGDISLDINTVTLKNTENGVSVRLTEKELRILEYLMANPGQVISRERLAVRVWGYDSDARYNNVEVYLSLTRKRLISIDSRVEIKSLRGLGYELRLKDV